VNEHDQGPDPDVVSTPGESQESQCGPMMDDLFFKVLKYRNTFTKKEFTVILCDSEKIRCAVR